MTANAQFRGDKAFTLAAAGQINDKAAIKATSTVRILAPPDRIWKLLGEIDRWPKWQPAISEAKLEGPLRPESSFAWVTGGTKIKSRLAAVTPGAMLSWTGTAFGAKAIHVSQIEIASGGSIVTTRESMDGLMLKVFTRPRSLKSPNVSGWMPSSARPKSKAYCSRQAVEARLGNGAPVNRCLLLFAFSFCLTAAPASAPRLSCQALQKIAIPGIIVLSSEDLPDGAELPAQNLQLPAHCLLRGEVNKHSGADGKSYGDLFELRLPAAWNGRLLFQGGGGLDGIVQPAIGAGGLGERPALARGYAVVSTDGGHAADPKTPMADGSFGSDPPALADYEYRSTQLVAAAAKKILLRHYGRLPTHSYFRGCSNGGREGLIAVQRYPSYFDGVIAGAPAFRLTRAMIAEAWNTIEWAALAPQNLRDALTDSDLQLVAHGVLAKCDALDGVTDDLIFNPAACHYDPAELQCPGEKTPSCLTQAQVAAFKKTMSGPVDSRGKALYADWPYDSGIAGPGWRAWILGSPTMPAINTLIFPAAVNGMALAGRPPPIDIFHFDFDADATRLNKTAAASLNADATNLSAFRAHGGKLILYTGMSDPVFSANDLIHYYQDIARANGGAAQTLTFARLFLLPGVNHCGGGPGLDSFDSLTALEAWVEDGVAPDRMVARGNAFPGRTRPLCPYPQTPHYNGTGNTENAAAFFCRN